MSTSRRKSKLPHHSCKCLVGYLKLPSTLNQRRLIKHYKSLMDVHKKSAVECNRWLTPNTRNIEIYNKLWSGLGPLDPGGPWHLSSLVQWVLCHCSETYITTLILLISGTFEAVWGGGCNMHFYHRNTKCKEAVVN